MRKVSPASSRNAPSQLPSASIGPTMSGTAKPPKLLPMVVRPITRPGVRGNQMETRRPAGRLVAPAKATYWRKLSTYQCQSCDMRGRNRKLAAAISSDQAMSGLAPRPSMYLPRNGAMRLPTATNASDALIAVRCHPNSSSSGPMNSPKA